jgi:hypothetical protein
VISSGGASRRLGGSGSPGDYATFKFPPTSRHDPAERRDALFPMGGIKFIVRIRYLDEIEITREKSAAVKVGAPWADSYEIIADPKYRYEKKIED